MLEDGRLESKVLTEDVPSVEGMSGGFVVKLTPGKQLNQYEFVGIQSEQSVRKDNVVSVRYSLARHRDRLH